MKVVVFSGWSGAGKTTLIEQVIAALKAAGQRVSVIKHAHHRFDIDHEGKDSWRHRKAGAYEVLVASGKRMALMREYETEVEPELHALIGELTPAADWVLVEGFKHADLPKIEVWRAEVGEAAQYPVDPFVTAVATDRAEALPEPTNLPVFALDDAPGLARWLLQSGTRYDYSR